jgi:anti-sigma-K factor RskA
MDVHELTAAYALDALSDEERDTYESHLAHCEQCRAELAGFSETTVALALAAPAVAPPAHLRAAILREAAAERANVIPLPARRLWATRATTAAASVAACIAVGLGVWATTLSRQLSSQKEKNTAAEILLDPSSQTAALRGGRGMVAVDADGRGVLLVHRLAAAPSGMTYEAWVIPHGGQPERAGLFHGGEPMTMLMLGRHVPAGALVAATVERAGGVARPTASPVFSAQT